MTDINWLIWSSIPIISKICNRTFHLKTGPSGLKPDPWQSYRLTIGDRAFSVAVLPAGLEHYSVERHVATDTVSIQATAQDWTVYTKLPEPESLFQEKQSWFK